MKLNFTILTFVISMFAGCSSKDQSTENLNTMNTSTATETCSSDCKAPGKAGELVCKLTAPELRERKKSVIASLKSQVIQKKELNNGFAFKFTGSDKVLDELTEFIKTERECCDFFVFNLSISGDKTEAWMELTGPDGAKEFINTELEL